MKGRAIDTHLCSTTRTQNSINGNARFTLHTEAGKFRTGTDSVSADQVQALTTNGSWDGEPAPIPVTIHVDGRGSVWKVEARS
jgi:hypothetical protein